MQRIDTFLSGAPVGVPSEAFCFHAGTRLKVDQIICHFMTQYSERWPEMATGRINNRSFLFKGIVVNVSKTTNDIVCF